MPPLSARQFSKGGGVNTRVGNEVALRRHQAALLKTLALIMSEKEAKGSQ